MENNTMNILHIDSSLLGTTSVSRELTKATVDKLKAANSGAHVLYRDLVENWLPHLDGAILYAVRQPADGLAVGRQLANQVAITEALISEFLFADVVVIGAPMYNFGIPTQLKAWIDRIAQPGRTFKYTEAGPVGLAGPKKVIIVSSRGGLYAGTPMENALDHQEAYLRAVMGFFGITDVEVVRAEGVAYGEDARAKAVAGAISQAAALTSGELAKAA
jgi:FMN-dependent NADH-azoreductase